MKKKSVSAKKNTTTSRSARALRYCAVPFAAFFAAQSASAAAIVWSGTTAIWATGTNWVGGAAPGSGDTAVFNGTGSNAAPDLGAGVTVNTISFETANAAAYTIGTGTSQPLMACSLKVDPDAMRVWRRVSAAEHSL